MTSFALDDYGASEEDLHINSALSGEEIKELWL
jgi:hypothetical protein